ncbi:DMT family transporter [Aquidulcibacter paucihalophilus]|uniref:DMT family transporter n=1 Tax=Aquidulcibacter paucihalophilus TaxID=1978549 RepID=UPI000A18E8BC|nr:DMT family transporter [Aquidulcibacter paucihalophilus]
MSTSNPNRAVYLALLAFFLLSLMDALIKHMGSHHSAVTVSFARFASAGVISLGIWVAAGAPRMTIALIQIHSLRGALQAVSMVLFAMSLANLKFLEAMSIAFLAPLLIPLLSAVILKEHLNLIPMVRAFLAFVGACLTAIGAASAPLSGANPTLGAATAIAAAFTYALSIVLLKDRAQIDGPILSGVFSSCIPALFIAPLLFVAGDPIGVVDLPAIVGLGVLSTAAMALLTLAYGMSDTQRIAPLEYSAAVWAGLLGWFVFKEAPNSFALAGCAIILATCLWSVIPDRSRTNKLNG